MIEMLKNSLFLFSWLKYPFLIFVGILIFYFVSFYAWIMIYNRKGIKKEGNMYSGVKLKKRSKLQRLLFDFPKQYILDTINRPHGFFKYQGLIIYEGRQGSGKTASMVHDSLRMMKEFPDCKLMSNLDIPVQTQELNHWKDLVDCTNGYLGYIAIIDELQNWFSSNQSKDFPPEMLSVITQNRKNRRVIFGTAQSFHLLAKTIRSQCIEVRHCTTIFGCITFVHRKEPILDSEGNVKEWKNRGIYFYVHDEELRTSYDTWKVVESLSKSGFKENNISEFNNYTSVIVKKK